MAVVTTAVASSFSASFSASALAPPMWPESRGITNCPASSMHTTAGSVFLLLTYGAISRTAMPQAPTKISASMEEKHTPYIALSSGRKPGSSKRGMV